MVEYLSKDDSESLLTENALGHLGCYDGFNSYVFPTNYVYDGKDIYCLSMVGAKVNIMRQNKRVCLQVDAVNDFDNWKSVMVHGDYSELADERERYYAIKKFNESLLHVKMSEGGKNTKLIIYKISVDEITGRCELASKI